MLLCLSLPSGHELISLVFSKRFIVLPFTCNFIILLELFLVFSMKRDAISLTCGRPGVPPPLIGKGILLAVLRHAIFVVNERSVCVCASGFGFCSVPLVLSCLVALQEVLSHVEVFPLGSPSSVPWLSWTLYRSVCVLESLFNSEKFFWILFGMTLNVLNV